MIGLGRMGANMVRRVQQAGHTAVVHDVDPEAIAALEAEGATGAPSLRDLADAMEAPRHVWVMVPAAITPQVLAEVAEVLEPGDVLVDGGNSFYADAMHEAERLAESGIVLLDCGTSGGVWGLERGYSLMIGGDPDAVEAMAPIFDALAPGLDAAPRTPGRDGDPAPEERGWLHCGQAGAGHFVKMVHNGIEYGMMAAYAEGFALLKAADAGLRDRDADAETAPLRHPDRYVFDLEIDRIAEVWRRGAVIGSWLLDLTAAALQEDHELDTFAGRVSDSGEGRWTVQAAIDVGAPAEVISSALFQRFSSRGNGQFAGQVLSAMRSQFGGHDEQPADPEIDGGAPE
nr:decarboxylating 6-phosphogluconate dehydrogenase [Salsipaludibacter albus]